MRNKTRGMATKRIHYLVIKTRCKMLKYVRYRTLIRPLRVLVRQHSTITIREKWEINRSMA